MHSPSKTQHTRDALLIIGFTLVIVAIQLIDLQRFIADDAYFYMTTARNLALTGQQTFSGIMPTNGVHPLWLYLLAGFYWLLSHSNPAFLYSPYSILPLSIILLGITAYLSWKIAGLLGLSPLILAILPIGYLAGFNLIGSEAYLLACCLTLLLYLSLKAGQHCKHAVLIGLVSAAVFLARLDMIFLVAIFYLWLLIIRRDGKFVLLALSVTAPLALIYVLSNVLIFGGPVPVSGWLKSTFPRLSIEGILFLRLGTSLSGYNLLFGVIPIVFATIMLWMLRQRLKAPYDLLLVLYGGSLLHFLYTAGFSRGATQWLWYYVLTFTLGVYVLAFAIHHLVKPKQQARIITSVLFLMGGFFSLYALRTATRPITWFDQGTAMLAYLEEHNLHDAVLIVGDSPGVVSFYSSNQVLGLDLLTANQNYVRSMLAAEHGFEFVLASAQASGKPVYILLTSGTWLGHLKSLPPHTTLSYHYLVPGVDEFKYMGTLQLNQPLNDEPYLLVWDVSP